MSSLRRFGAALFGALSLALLLGSAQSASAQTTFSNPAPVAIVDGSGGTPGAPYPSTINVSNFPGTVSKVTVRINGFTHSFPADVDLLLVAPNGQGVILMSDAGGPNGVAEMNLTFDDAAANPVPLEGPIETGTYKPTDYDDFGPDEYPAPAPSGPHATTLSAFNGINPNGAWGLYVVDDQLGDDGQISGGWSITISTPPTPVNPGDVVISEFRTRGPAGADDEFIELTNRTANTVVVGSSDGSAGWAVASSDGAVRFVVPNGTVIPAQGHFLAVNAGGYSLHAYPAGVNQTAKGDVSFTGDLPDATGLALFKTASAAGFTLANRLDAVGFSSVASDLYREGAGLSPATGIAENHDHTFARKLIGGPVMDNNNNDGDFWLLSTNAATLSGRGSILGTPGPENLSSPVVRNSPQTSLVVIDPAVAASVAPNRVRDTTPYTIAPAGTLAVRRTIVNNTGQPITRVRFRVTELTTKGNGGGLNGVSDVRVVTAPTVKATLSDGRVVKLLGAVLEQPAALGLDGGGLHSTLSIPLEAPIPAGGTAHVQFYLALNVTGSYRFYINTEILQ